MEQNIVTILGSGTSTGIPIIGCQCRVCNSSDPHDQRTRSSIFLETKNNNKIIVDTTPDMRSQILREGIKKCDACIITHEHADHIHGIDDLKPFVFDRTEHLPVYTYDKCADFLKEKFAYIFDTDQHLDGKKALGSGVPKLKLETIAKEFNIGKDHFKMTTLPHGHTRSLSFYHDGLAYIIDCKEVTQDWLDYLKAKKPKILIIDCVRRKPHTTHLHLEKSIEYARYIGAQCTYLTHLAHIFSHKELCEELKELDFNISVAFDGLKLSY